LWLLIGAAAMMLMGALPGFPTAPFLILAALLAVVGHIARSTKDQMD
jgi:type III secretion protein V